MLNENGQHNMDRMEGGSGQEDLNGPLGSQVEEPHRVPEMDWGSPLSLSPLASSGSAHPREIGLPPPSLIFHLPRFPCLLRAPSACLRGEDT